MKQRLTPSVLWHGLALALIIAGCGEKADDDEGNGTDDPTAPSATIEMTLSRSGGTELVPGECISFRILGDGTAFEPGEHTVMITFRGESGPTWVISRTRVEVVSETELLVGHDQCIVVPPNDTQVVAGVTVSYHEGRFISIPDAFQIAALIALPLEPGSVVSQTFEHQVDTHFFEPQLAGIEDGFVLLTALPSLDSEEFIPRTTVHVSDWTPLKISTYASIIRADRWPVTGASISNLHVPGLHTYEVGLSHWAGTQADPVNTWHDPADDGSPHPELVTIDETGVYRSSLEGLTSNYDPAGPGVDPEDESTWTAEHGCLSVPMPGEPSSARPIQMKGRDGLYRLATIEGERILVAATGDRSLSLALVEDPAVDLAPGGEGVCLIAGATGLLLDQSYIFEPATTGILYLLVGEWFDPEEDPFFEPSDPSELFLYIEYLDAI